MASNHATPPSVTAGLWGSPVQIITTLGSLGSALGVVVTLLAWRFPTGGKPRLARRGVGAARCDLFCTSQTLDSYFADTGFGSVAAAIDLLIRRVCRRAASSLVTRAELGVRLSAVCVVALGFACLCGQIAAMERRRTVMVARLWRVAWIGPGDGAP
jgi:hypothetical protein